MDALGEQKPKEFHNLALQFSDSYKKTTQLVSRFVMLGNDRNREAKVLALKFFGNVAQLERNILDPERLGLVDYRKRKHWSDEACAIFAKIERKRSLRIQPGAKEALQYC